MTDNAPVLMLRVDAGPRIGAGHMSRAGALADGWASQGGRSVLVTATPGSVPARLHSVADVTDISAAKSATEDASRTREMANTIRPTWVVVDGSAFDSRYLSAVKGPWGLFLIDDLGVRADYPVDLLLNQNIYADVHLYKGLLEPHRLLLGSDYVLLRSEFSKRTSGWGEGQRSGILVTLGGSRVAIEDALPIVLDAIDRAASERSVTLVLGGDRDLNRAGRVMLAGRQVAVVENATDMAELMSSSLLAISGAGTTVYELACTGTPSLLVQLGPDQVAVAAAAARAGFARDAGPLESLKAEPLGGLIRSLLVDEKGLRSMSEAGVSSVDGLGVDRVVARLLMGQRPNDR